MTKFSMTCALAVFAVSMLAAGTAMAGPLSPYNQPYGTQWNFMAEKVTRAGVVAASPDGSVWLEINSAR